jgi:hypothetical protein
MTYCDPLIAAGASSFFRRLFVFIGAQEGYAVLLKEKNQKFKKEGMLPPSRPLLSAGEAYSRLAPSFGRAIALFDIARRWRGFSF